MNLNFYSPYPVVIPVDEAEWIDHSELIKKLCQYMHNQFQIMAILNKGLIIILIRMSNTLPVQGAFASLKFCRTHTCINMSSTTQFV